MRRIIAIALVALVSCAGVQPSHGDGGTSNPVSWVSTAEVAVNILNTAIPGALVVVQSLPIDPAVKSGIVSGLQTAQASIPGVLSSLAAYRSDPSVANMCIARAATQLVASSLIAVSDGLASTGMAMPSMILMAAGGLGELIAELEPACPSDAGSAQSLALRLAPRPGLRPFPELHR